MLIVNVAVKALCKDELSCVNGLKVFFDHFNQAVANLKLARNKNSGFLHTLKIFT